MALVCLVVKSKDPILNVHHLESKKTGGNAPNNLITLCETCHKDYHRGKFELKIKRGTSLRDAAVMNIMRWAVYDKAKQEFANVHLTYGYITKNIRIQNGIVKTHAADARCIGGNPAASPLPFYYLQKQIRRHNRKIHKANILKGSKKKANQSPYMVKGSVSLTKLSTMVLNVLCMLAEQEVVLIFAKWTALKYTLELASRN